jgi:hypothetical protein
MGLQLAVDLHGADVDKAYLRLSAFHWSIEEPLTARVELHVYASQDAFAQGRQHLKTKEFAIDLTDENGNPDMVKVELLVRVRSLSYLEIKRFPEMEGALDV